MYLMECCDLLKTMKENYINSAADVLEERIAVCVCLLGVEGVVEADPRLCLCTVFGS